MLFESNSLTYYFFQRLACYWKCNWTWTHTTEYGACDSPVPRFHLDVYNNNEGRSVPKGTLGNSAIKTPFSRGRVGLYENNERYVKDYLLQLDGYYMTGDSAIIDEDSYVHIEYCQEQRPDDIINTTGQRFLPSIIESRIVNKNDLS